MQGRESPVMDETPFRYGRVEVFTLRQIDRCDGNVKGTAFRAFKRCLPELAEGRDFFVEPMAGVSDPCTTALIERMHAADALYPSSRVAILVTPGTCTRLRGVASLERR